jgi:hypothetical protein
LRPLAKVDAGTLPARLRRDAGKPLRNDHGPLRDYTQDLQGI